MTRYDDIAAATRDWETFSSASGIQVMTEIEDVERFSFANNVEFQHIPEGAILTPRRD